jgi:hypothetical protein
MHNQRGHRFSDSPTSKPTSAQYRGINRIGRGKGHHKPVHATNGAEQSQQSAVSVSREKGKPKLTRDAQQPAARKNPKANPAAA